MAVTAPTSRSDVRQLREEKKRREEEARRKEEERKADEGKRRPSIGYPGPKKTEGPKAPFDFEQSQRNQEENYRRSLKAQEEAKRYEASKRWLKTAKVNDQMDHMVDIVKREEAATRANRETARSLAPTVKQGLDALGQLSNLGTMTGAVRGGIDAIATAPRRQAIRDAIPEMPEPDNRTPGQRVDAQGPFANPADIERRGKARELEEDLQGSLEQYKPAYAEYTRRASALGIDAGDQMSLPEFAQDMMGVQDGEDGMGLEKVAPGVSPGQATRNIQPAPLDLDGEMRMANRQPDADNGRRIAAIIGDRKRNAPDAPIPEGIRAAQQAAGRDPYSGTPMVDGTGKVIAPVQNSTGGFDAQQYTRAIPQEVEDVASNLPKAEGDMYRAQAMGADQNIAPELREARSTALLQKHERLKERGYVPAATDPKTGNFVDPETGEEIRDEDGNPIRSNVPTAFDEDGNMIAGSQPVVYIRGTEARQRGAQRRNYQKVMRKAASRSPVATEQVAQFIDPATGAFDEQGFEELYPDTLPPDGTQRDEAIKQLVSQAQRSQAFQTQQRRRGMAQNMGDPFGRPQGLMMLESMQQARTPEERMAIARAFNDPYSFAANQQLAMADRGLAAEVEKSKQVAALRGPAGGGEDFDASRPGDSSKRMRQQIASGQSTPELAQELGATPEADQIVATSFIGHAVENGIAADAALNDPVVNRVITDLAKNYVPTKSFDIVSGAFDLLRGKPGSQLPLSDFETLRSGFIQQAMMQLGIPTGKGYEKALGSRFERMWAKTGRQLPAREAEERGVGEPDAEATMPPAGVGG